MKAVTTIEYKLGENTEFTVHAKNFMSGKRTQLRFKCGVDKFKEGVGKYDRGATIQSAFPFLTPTEREFLITGMTPEEQKQVFGE